MTSPETGQGRPPLPEEVFTNTFGEGEGELVSLTYPKPLPMRLDRWLVSQRTEQSRARIQKFIDAGYVRVNGKQGKAKTLITTPDAFRSDESINNCKKA